MKIAIIGRGKVGTGLARALRKGKKNRVSILGKKIRPQNLRNIHVVILALPDHAISSTSRKIAPMIAPNTIVVHCAGARSARDLDACRRARARVGVLHPMVSFANKKKSPSLDRAVLVMSGDVRAFSALKKLFRPLGIHVIRVKETNASYHAAASLAANGSVALAWYAQRILQRLGWPKHEAAHALAGLHHSVAENIHQLGLPDALTGPIARGDEATVRAHQKSLELLSEDFHDAYVAVNKLIRRTAKSRSKR